MSSKTLSEIVSVAQSFQRAMRLDRDIDADAKKVIADYVPQGTGIRVLEVMGSHIKGSTQRAFTWTGPYGSGKSSLALLLCSLVKGGETRSAALERLNLSEDNLIARTFAAGSWRIFAVTGRQGRLADDLSATFSSGKEDRAVVNAFRKFGESLENENGLGSCGENLIRPEIFGRHEAVAALKPARENKAGAPHCHVPKNFDRFQHAFVRTRRTNEPHVLKEHRSIRRFDCDHADPFGFSLDQGISNVFGGFGIRSKVELVA